jgi:RimJ/RimL family protein N-acetyltransferase
VATEAATMACATATRFGISRLIAVVHPDHVASRRVAERIGMHPERTALLDGDYPAVIYAAELS